MIPNTTKWNKWRQQQHRNGELPRDTMSHKQQQILEADRKKEHRAIKKITRWPIGTHKGKLVSTLSTSYLNWAIKNLDTYSFAYNLAAWELKNRSSRSVVDQKSK